MPDGHGRHLRSELRTPYQAYLLELWLTFPSGQQAWTEDSQSQPSPFVPCASLMLSGQQPSSESMQQPSWLGPCAGTSLSGQHPNVVFLHAGKSFSMTSTESSSNARKGFEAKLAIVVASHWYRDTKRCVLYSYRQTGVSISLMVKHGVQRCEKLFLYVWNFPASVQPGNLASPCTANQPISESLSSIVGT